ncbi:MAG: HEAT repeat domain-containing protein [bacterium]
MEVALLSLGIGTFAVVTVAILSGLTGLLKAAKSRLIRPLILSYSYRNPPALDGSSERFPLDETDTLRSIALEISFPPHLRGEAVFSLGRHGDREVVSDLLEFLNSPHPEIRKGAVDGLWALLKRGVVDSPIDSFLTVVRCDKDADVRRRAVSAMEVYGSGATQHLIVLLDHMDRSVRIEAGRVLGRLGDRRGSVPLIARLNRGSYEERKAVLEALGNMRAADAVAPIIELFDANRPDAPIARDAAKALALIGDERAIPHIGRAILEQLATTEKPHRDMLFSYQKLMRGARKRA